MRYNAHAGLFIDVKKVVLISPNGMYMSQAKAQQWIAGSTFSFNLSGKSEPYKTAISAGVWVDGGAKNTLIPNDKSLNSIISSVSVSFMGLQIGVSYDATIKKDLSKADKSLALEASIIYTSKPWIRRELIPPLLCLNSTFISVIYIAGDLFTGFFVSRETDFSYMMSLFQDINRFYNLVFSYQEYCILFHVKLYTYRNTQRE